MNHAFLVVLGNHYADTSVITTWLKRCRNNAFVLLGLMPERNPAVLYALSKKNPKTFNLIILNNHRIAITLFARDSLLQANKKYNQYKAMHLWWHFFAKHVHSIHLRTRLIKQFIESCIDYNEALLHYIRQTPEQNRLVITSNMLTGYEKSIFAIISSQFQHPMQYTPINIVKERLQLRKIKDRYCWFPNRSALLNRLEQQEKLLKSFISYNPIIKIYFSAAMNNQENVS
jgi:hypothetical protein